MAHYSLLTLIPTGTGRLSIPVPQLSAKLKAEQLRLARSSLSPNEDIRMFSSQTERDPRQSNLKTLSFGDWRDCRTESEVDVLTYIISDTS